MRYKFTKINHFSSPSLVKQYGKVFFLRLGGFKVVVAASADSVKECVGREDWGLRRKATLSRI